LGLANNDDRLGINGAFSIPKKAFPLSGFNLPSLASEIQTDLRLIVKSLIADRIFN
jgi:hypothetical protein